MITFNCQIHAVIISMHNYGKLSWHVDRLYDWLGFKDAVINMWCLVIEDWGLWILVAANSAKIKILQKVQTDKESEERQIYSTGIYNYYQSWIFYQFILHVK